MADTFPSPYMDMQIPTPTVAPGPEWATLLNECLLRIDSHAHADGNGLPISSSAILLSTDFSFNGFNAIDLRSVRLNSQAALITLPADLGAVYNFNGNLYYNNSSGVAVQITNGSSVAGAAGNIGGLAPPASATYVAVNSTFVFQSASNVAANLDARSITLRNATASSFGLTLSPPALSGDTNITLPPIPAQTNVMTIGASGIMNSITYDELANNMGSSAADEIANNRTRAVGISVPAGGIAISNSSNFFLTTSSTLVDVTNLSVTITTTGRPVLLMLISDGTLNDSSVGAQTGSNINSNGSFLSFVRGGTQIAKFRFFITAASSILQIQVPGGSTYIDVVAAGTYTYKVQISTNTGNPSSAVAFNLKLVAFEL